MKALFQISAIEERRCLRASLILHKFGKTVEVELRYGKFGVDIKKVANITWRKLVGEQDERKAENCSFRPQTCSLL